jgi:hypothetical protein
MNFDIVVKGFRNKGARMVVARHLVRDEGITLPDALARTSHLPVTLFRSIDRETIATTLNRYGKLGIDVEAIETVPVQGTEMGSINFSQPPLNKTTTPKYPVSAPATIVRPAMRSRDSLLDPATSGPSAPPKKRVGQAIVNLAVVVGILALTGSVFFLVSRVMPRTPKTRIVDTGGDRSSPSREGLENKELKRQRVESRQTAGAVAAEKEKALHYVDSAKASGNDAEAAIHFYKMAIAFNRRNINAWYGLIDAYRQSGRINDEKTARAEMNALFGESAASVEQLMRPFGELTEMHYGDDGLLSIEYRTKCPAERDKLLKEAFLVARALSTICDCSKLSLFLSTGRSRGLVAHCGTKDGFPSVGEFEKRAVLYFFDALTFPDTLRNR